MDKDLELKLEQTRLASEELRQQTREIEDQKEQLERTVANKIRSEVNQKAEELAHKKHLDRLNEAKKPGYLDLMVDRARGEVRRKGHTVTAYFEVDSAEWHTFIVAFDAGERGATEDRWESGYPGEMKPAAMRVVKARVRGKLKVLDVTLKGSVPPRLIDSPDC